MHQVIGRLNNRAAFIMMAVVLVVSAVAAFASNASTVSANEPPGATLYEEINFNNDPKHSGGASLTTNVDIACIQKSPHFFPKTARSLKVVPGTIVILYEKCNYQGKSAGFMEHDGDLKKTITWRSRTRFHLSESFLTSGP